MNTFVPRNTYWSSAKILDQKRLNKQIVEGTQIAQILYHKQIFSNSKRNFDGWANHPAVLMWKDCKHGLLNYINFCIIESKNRGYLKDTMIDVEFSVFIDSMDIDLTRVMYPSWWNSDIHYSHASALLFKSWIKMVVYKLSHDNKVIVNQLDQSHILRNLSNFKKDQVIKELDRFNKAKYIVSLRKLNTEISIFKTYYAAFSNISPRLEYYWPV